MATAPETQPVLTAEWQTDVLDTGEIHDAVNRLWDQLGGRTMVGKVIDEYDADVASLGGGLMRAATLNLIAVAENDRDAGEIGDTVGRLHDFLPSRTIILVVRQPHESKNDVTFTVRVELREQQGTKEEAGLKYETITIGADARQVGRLASLVSPLLKSELPDYLLWPYGDYHRSPLFQDLVDIVDRLIVDSARLGPNVQGMSALQGLVDTDSATAVIGDLTWLRLAPWRQLIAQFFDPEDVQEYLDDIDQVNIAYAETRPDGSSGLASALLTIGWLGSRLGWEVVEPLEQQKAGGSWVSVRTRSGTRYKDIQIRLVPDHSAHARFSLRSVELVTAGERVGVFRVERTDEDDLITSSQMPGGQTVGRMVYSRRPENVGMLATELQRLGHDRVLEEALLYAMKLLT